MSDPTTGGRPSEDRARRSYANAGVDVAAGDRAVDLLRERIERSGAAGLDLLGGLGGFAAALPLPPGYREPVLVTSSDGVGTKTEIARRLGRRDTIGQDLVAMCADDVVCHGARPYAFLDYLAVGRLNPDAVAEIVGGIAEACARIRCTLAGGETAEHPGLMAPDAFDLAGFCLGIVERDELLDGSRSEPGDVVVGIASSGLHANGYSLVRRVIEDEGLDIADPFGPLVRRVLGREPAAPPSADGSSSADGSPSAESSLGDALLRPTALYARHVLKVRDDLAGRGRRLAGIAHVTGGGLPGNLPRAVPAGLGVRVDPSRWPVPDVIELVAALAGLGGEEMRATFNAGIGMALVVEPAGADDAVAHLAERGLPAWVIGDVLPEDELGARYVEVPA
jgi:phosphoribosylformylglycinamidine cyclo-ligase